MITATQSDAMIYADENFPPGENLITADSQSNWKIMIIDDEQAVHSVTTMALRNLRFEGRGITFISAMSAMEAQILLAQHPDTAVVLLDVVMETDHAGLDIARYIREYLKNSFIRIILRTGQAGQAPEEKVIIEYDINDYKEKTELTACKLFTAIVSALRAYRDIVTIDANRRGLEKIIDASATLFKLQSMTQFVSGVLSQLVALLGLNKSALYCHTSGFAATNNLEGDFRILAATGDFEKTIHRPVKEALPPQLLQELNHVLDKKETQYLSNRLIGYFGSSAGSESIIYLEGFRELDDVSKDLITVFLNNVSTGFDNLFLHKELEDNQIELLFTLGEMAEIRSRETGNHVKRVATYSKLLAEKSGLSTEDTETLNLAASMHDIGKLAVEDTLLNKPGTLTAEEFEIIKGHSYAGYNLLKSSSRKLLQTAALIALQHHEKYDGSGYPNGLQGEQIHIFGRITALADVFDALSTDRVYRKAWSIPKTVTYIREQRGKHFDPQLVDIFLNNLQDFLTIQETFADHAPPPQ